MFGLKIASEWLSEEKNNMPGIYFIYTVGRIKVTTITINTSLSLLHVLGIRYIYLVSYIVYICTLYVIYVQC